MLSKTQFEAFGAGLAQPGEQGFSVNVNTGETPSSGYMVSRGDTEEREIPVQGAARGIVNYTRSNREGLVGRNANFLGGWKPKGSTTAFLDQSQRFDSSAPDSLTSAMDMALAHRQQAIYDVGSDRSITSPDWKHWPRDRD